MENEHSFRRIHYVGVPLKDPGSVQSVQLTPPELPELSTSKLHEDVTFELKDRRENCIYFL